MTKKFNCARGYDPVSRNPPVPLVLSVSAINNKISVSDRVSLRFHDRRLEGLRSREAKQRAALGRRRSWATVRAVMFDSEIELN